MTLPLIYSGDAGLSASKGMLSKIIRFGGALQTGKADRSHAFCGIESGMIIEALVRVRINDASKYDKQDIELYRPPLTNAERKSFHIGMIKVAGDSYGWGKPFLAGLDSIATGFKKLFTLGHAKEPVFFFSQTMGFFSFKDCSQLLVWGWHNFTDYRLMDEYHKVVPWKCATPDYCQDLFSLPHNRMKLYYKQLDGGQVVVDLRNQTKTKKENDNEI